MRDSDLAAATDAKTAPWPLVSLVNAGAGQKLCCFLNRSTFFGVRVVRATVEDAELCFGIAHAAAVAGFQHVFPPDLYEFPGDAIRADWISALTDPDGETYIAFEDDEAVGVVSVGHGVLQTLYVMPEFWSRGIGSMLHDRALDRLREVNVQEARLWTLTDNHRARAFYEKRGWSLTGRTRVVPFPPHPIDVEYARSTLRS